MPNWNVLHSKTGLDIFSNNSRFPIPLNGNEYFIYVEASSVNSL